MGVSCSPAMIQYGPAGEDRSTVQIIFAWYGSALSNCYPQVIVITCIGLVSLFVVGKDFLAVKANVALDGHTMALFPVAFLLVSVMACPSTDISRVEDTAAASCTRLATCRGWPTLTRSETPKESQRSRSTWLDYSECTRSPSGILSGHARRRLSRRRPAYCCHLRRSSCNWLERTCRCWCSRLSESRLPR